MKTIIRVILAGVLASLALGCMTRKDEIPESVSGRVFHASLEQPSEGDTRVYVSSYRQLLWDEDDRISVFDRTDANTQFRFTGSTGDALGEFEQVGEASGTGNPVNRVYAVYPYAASNTVLESGKLSIVYPKEQYYRRNSFGGGANVMVSATENDRLQFWNACGYLCLTLYGKGVSVSSVTLRGNDGEILAGRGTVDMTSGIPSVSMEGADKEITLICDEPVQLEGTSSQYTNHQFWLTLPPVSFRKGFTVTVRDASGGYFVKSTDKPITIERNRLSRMAITWVWYQSDAEIIDLGLSVKWRNRNIGADNPEDSGRYLAWGEVYSKEDYSLSTYAWYNDYSKEWTKYCSSYLFGIVDGKSSLDAGDDAAHVILGGHWRMPASDEMNELGSFSRLWTEVNGVAGVWLISPRNGHSIFLPLAGRREGRDLIVEKPEGAYWGSALRFDFIDTATILSLETEYHSVFLGGQYRYIGLPIRPVYDE